MRDTVADPRLIVLNKPRYSEVVSSSGNLSQSSSTRTAGFGRSPSEVLVKD